MTERLDDYGHGDKESAETPRTDEQQRLWRERIKGYEQYESVPDEIFEHARQLERELAEVREELALTQGTLESRERNIEAMSALSAAVAFCPACEKEWEPQSATTTIKTIPLIKRLQRQRDRVAAALRRVWRDDGTQPRDLAHEVSEALADCPTPEQQLRNIAEGLGMTDDELVAGIDRATKNTPDSGATK